MILFPPDVEDLSCILAKAGPADDSVDAMVFTLPCVPRLMIPLPEKRAFPSWLSSVKVLLFFYGSFGSLKVDTIEGNISMD